MILPVANLQIKNSQKINYMQKTELDYMRQNAKFKFNNDNFSKSKPNIAFNGRKVAGRDYTDQELADVKSGIKNTSDLVDRYNFFKYVFTNAPEKHIQRLEQLRADLNEENKQELEAQVKKLKKLKKKKKELKRQENAAKERNEQAIKKVDFTQKMYNLQNQLKTEFCDKVNMEKQGAHIKYMPNAIMIEDQYDDISNDLIDYTRRNSQSRFIKLADSDNDTLTDNLDETLKKSKTHFDTTKERTLIHVEGFDRLITKGKNTFENIDSLKDIMTRSAKDFGSTIIFKTKDISKLVSEAIQPHRVEVKVLVDFEGFNKFVTKKQTYNPDIKKIAQDAVAKILANSKFIK